MKLEMFAIPALLPGQEISRFNTFAASHRIASVEKQFVANGDQSFWSICVSFEDGEAPSPAGRRGKVDYRDILSPEDFAVYAKLRTLRNSLATESNMPAYNVFNNEELATMVTGRVRTRAALAEIQGVGPAKMEKYADLFLPILCEEFPSQEPDKAQTGA